MGKRIVSQNGRSIPSRPETPETPETRKPRKPPETRGNPETRRKPAETRGNPGETRGGNPGGGNPGGGNPGGGNPGQYTQIGFLKADDGVLSVLSRVSPAFPPRVSPAFPLGVVMPGRAIVGGVEWPVGWK